MNQARARVTKKECATCAERKPIGEFMVSAHRDGSNGRDDTLDNCRQCCMKPTILERIERWHGYATQHRIKLDCILVHPLDYREAPSSYEGLPVRSIGMRA